MAHLLDIKGESAIFYRPDGDGDNLKELTHGLIKLFIAAMAYYINTLDSQSSGRGRCGPNYFKVGDLF